MTFEHRILSISASSAIVRPLPHVFTTPWLEEVEQRRERLPSEPMSGALRGFDHVPERHIAGNHQIPSQHGAQRCARFGFYLGEKNVDVFAHQRVQHGGFRAATLGMGLRSLRLYRARRANSSRRAGLHLTERGLGFIVIMSAGSFIQISGSARASLASFGKDGILTAWNPNSSARVPKIGLALAHGPTVYVAPKQSSPGDAGQVAAINPNASFQNLSIDTNFEVSAITVRGSSLFIGGYFTKIHTPSWPVKYFAEFNLAGKPLPN